MADKAPLRVPECAQPDSSCARALEAQRDADAAFYQPQIDDLNRKVTALNSLLEAGARAHHAAEAERDAALAAKEKAEARLAELQDYVVAADDLGMHYETAMATKMLADDIRKARTLRQSQDKGCPGDSEATASKTVANMPGESGGK